jgi:hypothetical protein
MVDMKSIALRDCVLIVGAWTAFLISIAILQWLGFGLGFDIWPFGEDLIGVISLQQPDAGSAASLAWQLNDRNPLSPWVLILFRKIILNFDSQGFCFSAMP